MSHNENAIDFFVCQCWNWAKSPYLVSIFLHTHVPICLVGHTADFVNSEHVQVDERFGQTDGSLTEQL